MYLFKQMNKNSLMRMMIISLNEIKETLIPFFPKVKWESGRGWMKMIGIKAEILITGSEIVVGFRHETGIGKGKHFDFDANAEDLSALMPALNLFEGLEK